ncbi:MAG TPA: hypothetical protein VG722_04485 [Tepidisphaeraceae bacterium]|nr:hypothetical protein [Tepidisphaeraceae bacterium]
MESTPIQSRSGSTGLFTIPMFCLGIAIVACCVLIPQTDANRHLAYERFSLQRDLAQLEAQGKANQDFLKHLTDDPTLAQRLAQRQMKLVPEGTNILDLGSDDQGAKSPFLLVQIPAPAKLAPYQPAAGHVLGVFLQQRPRLYLLGGGMFLIAAGLVLGMSN